MLYVYKSIYMITNVHNFINDCGDAYTCMEVYIHI